MGWNPFKDSWGFDTGGWSGLESSIKNAVEDYVSAVWEFHVKIAEETFRVFGFEGQTIYTVQVINQQLIPDKQTSFAHKLVLNHVLNGQNIAAAFQLSLATGVHSSVKSFLRYGETTYVNGLPTLTNSITGISTGAVDDAITTEEGVPVTVVSATLTYLTPGSWARFWLQENTAYTYYNDQIVVGPDTYEYSSLTDTGSNYTAAFVRIDGTGPPTYQETGIPYEDDSKSYISAIYALDSAISEHKIWLYDRDLGTYPDLDPVSPTADDSSTVLPVVVIRRNFVSMDAPGNEAEFTSGNILLKKLNMQMQATIDSLSNPDDAGQIDQIEDAFVTFGLDLYTESVPVLKAIRETFDYLYQIQTTNKIVFDQQEPTGNPTPNVFSVTETSYNIAIEHNYIDINTIPGTFNRADNSQPAEIGYTESEIDIQPTSLLIDDPNYYEEFLGDPNVPKIGGIPQSTYTIREQFDGYYTETLVHGLTVSTGIATDPGKLKFNLQELSTAVDRQSLIIPLIMSCLTDLRTTEQEEVLYASMLLTIYAQDSQYLEWYETPQFLNAFQIVLIVVAVVIAIYSGGSAASVVFELMKNLAYQYALRLALEEILRHNISDDAKVLVYIGYAVAAVYGATGFDFSFDTLVTADTMLLATNAVTEAYMSEISLELGELETAYAQLDQEIQEQQKLLEEANSRFQKLGNIDPLLLASNYRPNAYESVNEFYQRTIHTGNPGILTLNQIQDFHDNALELPELN